MSNFIKLHHNNPAVIELLKHPNEWILLTVIAVRASRTDKNLHGLGVRQALIGDYTNYGLTEQKYRTAKSNVHRWGFATFKGTSKGTIATLCNDAIYNINPEKDNEQDNEQITDKLTDKQRTNNEQITTNKNGKKGKNGKKEEEDAEKKVSKKIRRVFNRWNEIASEKKHMPKVSVLNSVRKGHISARLKEFPDWKDWMKAFEYIQISEYLGEEELRWWEFDWFVKNPINFEKVLQGKYNKKSSVSPKKNNTRNMSDWSNMKKAVGKGKNVTIA